MGLWNIAYRHRFLTKYYCNMLKFVSSKHVSSHFGPYNTSKPPCAKDRAIKTVATKRILSSKPVISNEWQDKNRSKCAVSFNAQPAERKVFKKMRQFKGTSQEERREPSELYKLSFEDFTEDWEKPVRGNVTRDSTDDYEVVFGIYPCLLALTLGRRKAFKLLVKEGELPDRTSLIKVCEEARRRGVHVKRVSKKHLDGLATGCVHQGVCLLASRLSCLTEERAFTPARRRGAIPLWLVLDGIQDPMNLGAILRSAYFLGVDRVATSLHNSCPLTPLVSKASSGVMEVIDIYGYESLEEMLKLKVLEGWHVVGTVGAQVQDCPITVTRCSDFQMTKPTLLLMGGEGEGVSQRLLSQCQTLLTISPCRDLIPGIESLNVSVATGILLHSLLAPRTPKRL